MRLPRCWPVLAGVLFATRPAAAIVGPATEGGAISPYVVMILQRSGTTAGFCSGIVIDKRAVLTAAHCVPPGADLRIHFRDDNDKPVLLPVTDVIRNPGYRADAVKTRQRSIDLAVIRLPADLPDQFRPARLGTLGSTAVGTRFRVAGYGVTHEGDGSSSGHLKVAEVVARSPLSTLLLWAKGANASGGACTGDSGGPIVDADGDTVEALTLWSAGAGKSTCGDLTQAIWIAPFRAWIDQASGADR